MLDARRLPFECFHPWSAFVNLPSPSDSDRTYLSIEGIHSPFSFGFSVCSLCTSSSTPNLIRPSFLPIPPPIVIITVINARFFKSVEKRKRLRYIVYYLDSFFF